MIAERPSWIHPGFRLVEGEACFGWSELVSLPVPAGGIVPADRTSLTVAALAAAQRADAGLLLRRHAGPGEDWVPPPGFTVTLESSGTTGTPKRITHDFNVLRDRIRAPYDAGARWLLTYEPAAFAGLQVILTAAAAGALLVAAAPGGGIAGLVRTARQHAVTHVSGTPSFWRAFLTAGGDLPSLRSITLGGEAADQALLDRLRRDFPAARIRHIYASTEAGALFAVTDGQAGFPAAWLVDGREGTALRIREGVLEVRGPRAMVAASTEVGTGDGWLNTGDLVEVTGGRVLFAGRLDGLVNVGGVKVSPERVEQRLLAVPGVADAAVMPVASPITGFLLTATVVPDADVDEAALRDALRGACAGLVPAARPRAIRFADSLPLSVAGKKSRKGPS
ncbi:class I adenylate-forming enzyme family protein [Azospirillum agricola]|uniref:class I adenylate-forming enzyme family protein n=1 Tax=Azospirillum agricola TaxID=1720247 RepID=UPI000A0F0605|nr:fatty acid--CoA ligase family protein [Azospirillum agricola]SMH45487.1 Acyl-CoA synthetase (AMP-forming)/AMP-acid ligase II [Azospirillum lipoferum]